MRIKKFCIISLIFLFGGLVSMAQSGGNYQKSFNNGKDLFDLEKYALAMEAFKPLTLASKKNEFAEYASFYYGLSAYQAGQKAAAKNMFLQLISRHSSWEKIDNVFYWLSKIYFEENDYVQALTHLNKIENKEVKADAVEMKIFYLDKIEDIKLLQQLLQQNPYDKEIATVLAEEITEQPLASKNRQLLDFLIDEFELDKRAYSLFEVGDSEKKERYNVAVLFPFMHEDISPEKNPMMNQFVLDTYEGIQMAIKKLEEEGIAINLYAYDTRRDSTVTAGILAMDELKSMDLLIGPLYPVPSRMVSRFSTKYKINMVNPLSTNSQVIGNNPLSFLYKPSLETQASNAAEYASQTFTDKTAMIIYGESPKDSVMAFTYREAIEQDSFKVVTMARINASNAHEIIKTLAPEEMFEEDYIKTEKDSLGHIFVASSDELIVANTISAVEIRGDGLPVIGLEEWLDLKFVSYEQLERLQIVLIAPEFLDYEKPLVKEFKKAYINETNSLPSHFAYTGYDMMLYFGRMMDQYGTYFQTGFEKEGFQEGFIFPGYNFAKSNDNQFVPIVKFKDAELAIVNGQE